MRLPKLSYDELSPEQKVAWDEVVAGPRRKMHGPFFIWLHSPEPVSYTHLTLPTTPYV